MKKLLLLLTMNYMPLHSMDAIPPSHQWIFNFASPEEQQKYLDSIKAELAKKTHAETAIKQKLETLTAASANLPDYENVEASPWHNVSARKPQLIQMYSSLLNGNPETQQQAQILLNNILTFWLDPKLNLTCPRVLHFPTEINAHYNAIARAMLNGAQPQNPIDLEMTLQQIHNHAETDGMNIKKIPPALPKCYAVCRALVLPDLQDPDPTDHWPRHWKEPEEFHGVIME